MVQAWYMDDVTEDQRHPHKKDPDVEVSLDDLKKLGVLYFNIKVETGSKELEELKKERGYTYEDTITCSPDKLPNYEAKLKSFFEEHIHTDEEIRYILEGSGYFDVRDTNDKWIRIEVVKDDLLILPAGIYHRFTLDQKNYIVANRLFVGEPVWTPHNRSVADTDEKASKVRDEYVKNFIEAES